MNLQEKLVFTDDLNRKSVFSAENGHRKMLITRLFHSIISGIKNFFVMMFSSRALKVVVFSVAGFGFGVLIALAGFTAAERISVHDGMGGFETASLPEFNSEYANLFDPISQNSSGTDEVADDAAVQEQPFSPLTYQTYRVRQGDMIGFIADKYNVTQDTIISVNNIRQSRLIQVGQYLKIPSMPGILYTVRTDGETPLSIAEKYESDADKCALVNMMSLDTSLSAGTTVFVPDAELDWVTRQEINGDLFHKPLHGRYWLSSNYGWRSSPFSGKRSFHGGVDMAANAGTSIFAALDGRVTAAGYNSTYGNYVIITHHSGYKTLYAHMSEILCVRNQWVSSGTRIGRVGSTGLSTGPHLHFTVYKNGKTVNPLSLIN